MVGHVQIEGREYSMNRQEREVIVEYGRFLSRGPCANHDNIGVVVPPDPCEECDARRAFGRLVDRLEVEAINIELATASHSSE